MGSVELIKQRLDNSIKNARQMLDVSIKVANQRFEDSINNAKAQFEDSIKHSKHVLDTSIDIAKKSLEESITEFKQQCNELNQSSHRDESNEIPSKRPRLAETEIKQEPDSEEEIINTHNEQSGLSIASSSSQNNIHESTITVKEEHMQINTDSSNNDNKFTANRKQEHSLIDGRDLSSHPKAVIESDSNESEDDYPISTNGVTSNSLSNQNLEDKNPPTTNQHTIIQPYRNNQEQSSHVYSTKRLTRRYSKTNLSGIISDHLVSSFNAEIHAHYPTRKNRDWVSYFDFNSYIQSNPENSEFIDCD